MTLGTMTGLVSQRLNEAFPGGILPGGPTFYPTSEITAAINEAYRFFVLLTLGLEKTTAWSVPPATTMFHMLAVSSGGVLVFRDWITALRISTATGAKVRPARLDELTSLDSKWVKSPGAPIRYNHVGADLLSIYRQPAGIGTVLQVTYARSPLPLVNVSDIPEVPAEYHPKFIDYAINRVRQVEGGEEFAKTLPLLGLYIEAAKKYAAYVDARNIGARYDKVPFELGSFDTSQLLKLRGDLPPSRKAA